jgi:hypothetical protein
MSNGMLISTAGPIASIEPILLIATSLTTSSISSLFMFLIYTFATNLCVETLFSRKVLASLEKPFNFDLIWRLSTLIYTRNFQMRTRYSAIIPLLLILIRYTARGAILLSSTVLMRWRRRFSSVISDIALSVVIPAMNR